MDTIAAIATPLSPCAVGILRISGPEAVKAASTVFTGAGGASLAGAESHRLIYGTVSGADGRVLDYCLCAVMRSPHSYTGEDVVELFCHGSPIVLTGVLSLLYAQGVRAAQPGEFTRRAFLNGRLDLAQAEAVADLISAQTDGAARSAAGQLGGSVSRQVKESYEALADIASHFQAVVDFPEEDVDPFELCGIKDTLALHARRLHHLADTYARGRILREGAPCAIIGKPNVGKSSVLNALLGYDRAIVTRHAGTTRDTLEETVSVNGVGLRLTDTAGIRETSDEIERMGVERARIAADGAQLVLLVLDGSSPLDTEDFAAMEHAAGKTAAVLVNKSDLPQNMDPAPVRERFDSIFFVSAKTGEGFDAFKDHVKTLFSLRPQEADGSLVTNARHASCIARAADALDAAVASLGLGMTADVILTDAEDAMRALGEVTGVSVSQDIVERIFSRFCVGK